MQTHRAAHPLTALLLLVVVGVGRAEPIDLAAADPADHTHDHWYLDTIDGQASGYWRSWLAVEDEHLVSGYHEVGVETHGGEPLTTTTRVVWTETRDFRPVRIVVEQSSGSDTVKQTYRFNDAGITLTSEQAGRSITQSLPPIKRDYLTAAQHTIAIDLHRRRGDRSFELPTLDPLIGMTPYLTRFEKQDNEKPGDGWFALADGSKVRAGLWRVTYDILPGVETAEWIDPAGRSVGLSYDIGGMTLVARLGDESVAQAELDPPEMAQLSVVVPDRPIKHVQRQRKIIYELQYRAGDAGVAPIQTAHQSVERLGEGRVRLTVDLDAAAGEEAAANDRPTAANLAASIRIDHADPVVQALAAKAIRTLDDQPSSLKIAQACKRFVSGHVRGATLAVGDATASETARTGRGDCTECSVLLAALLRADGIPSRCVSGLVYSEQAFAGTRDAFVYHQWTQAWIQEEPGTGRWIDLDAAMWRYSAGHLALGVSDMGDDDQADFIKLIPMTQDLQIKVIQTRR